MAAASVTVEANGPYGSSIAHLHDELGRIELLVRGQVARAREANGNDAWRGLAISEAEVDSLLQRTLGSPPWDLAPSGPPLADAHAVGDVIAQSISRRRAITTSRLRLAELATN